jgi:hypothetical protein
MQASDSFWYEPFPGGEVFVPKGKVVVDGHPDVKGHEVYFKPVEAEAVPVPPRRRTRVRGSLK